MKQFSNEVEKKEYLDRNLNYYSDYFEAMFWADVDDNESIENREDLTIYDIEEESLLKQIEELDNFFSQAEDVLELTEYSHEQACHDFYFTRNGHGVGFWENDHCEDKEGKILTDLSHSFGETWISEHNGKVIVD